jgi:hypothetical protein
MKALNVLFNIDSDFEIDETDIELVEPLSDVRWQKNEVLLPFDRPLPKVEDQQAQAILDVTPVFEVVTPVVETFTPIPAAAPAPAAPAAAAPAPAAPAPAAVAAATPITTAAAAPIPQMATPSIGDLRPGMLRENSASDLQGMMPTVAEKLEKMLAADSAQAGQAGQPGQVYAGSSPIPVTTTHAIPVAPDSATPFSAPMPASPVPIPTSSTSIPASPVPIPAPSVSTAASSAPIDIAVSADYEVRSPHPQRIAIASDDTLDIEDYDEDEDYDEEDYEGEERVSSPLFILIVFIILLLQVVFVGWLVSAGLIDLTGLMDFFSGQAE